MFILVIPAGKYAKPFMAEHLYLWREPSGNNIHHVIIGKTFIQRFDCFQCHHYFIFGFYSFFWMPAIIAVATILFFILFPEITQDYFATANPTLRITNRFIDELCANFSFTERLVTHQVFQLAYVFMRVIKNTTTFQPVATR